MPRGIKKMIDFKMDLLLILASFWKPSWSHVGHISRPRTAQEPFKTPPRRFQEPPKTPLRASQDPVPPGPMGYPCFGRRGRWGTPFLVAKARWGTLFLVAEDPCGTPLLQFWVPRVNGVHHFGLFLNGLGYTQYRLPRRPV